MTRRQSRILAMQEQGLTNRQMATALDVSVATIWREQHPTKRSNDAWTTAKPRPVGRRGMDAPETIIALNGDPDA